MTKKRFIIQLVLVILIITWGIVSGGNNFLLYVDAPTMIFVPIIPYIIATFIYPFGEQKVFYKEIFKPEGSGNKKELEQAITFFTLLKQLTIASTIVVSFVGIIGILGYMSDSETMFLARNFGVVSIGIFYVAIFLLVIVEPLKGAAKKNLIG